LSDNEMGFKRFVDAAKETDAHARDAADGVRKIKNMLEIE